MICHLCGVCSVCQVPWSQWTEISNSKIHYGQTSRVLVAHFDKWTLGFCLQPSEFSTEFTRTYYHHVSPPKWNTADIWRIHLGTGTYWLSYFLTKINQFYSLVSHKNWNKKLPSGLVNFTSRESSTITSSHLYRSCSVVNYNDKRRQVC